MNYTANFLFKLSSLKSPKSDQKNVVSQFKRRKEYIEEFVAKVNQESEMEKNKYIAQIEREAEKDLERE